MGDFLHKGLKVDLPLSHYYGEGGTVNMSEQNQVGSPFLEGGSQSQGERNTVSDSVTNQNQGIITHRSDGTLDYNDELRTPNQQ